MKLWERSREVEADRGAFLTRLARDKRGNTLAIMAAALVPMIGFAGSAIDLARMYVVKVRLQQACDAGVLAGRKAMTDTNVSTPLDASAATQANTFFANNFFAKYDPTAKTFTGSWYQTNTISFTPVKATNGTTTVANAVTGTAQATVPMTLMQYFKVPPVQLSVSCQAIYDLADTDIMFVLDTTGSMSCYPNSPATCANTPSQQYTRADGSPGYYDPESPPTTSGGVTTYSKIESLRQAVMLFDTTMRANVDTTTHFRYGFVTYTSAVNVGKIIPSQYLQNTSWTYQSRHLSSVIGPGGVLAGDYAYGSASTVTLTGVPQAMCVAQRYPGTGFSTSGPVTGSGPAWTSSYPQAMKYYNVSWTASNGGTCSGSQQPLRPYWRYEPVSWPINQYVAGNVVTDPSRLDGKTSTWRGCIEELDTRNDSPFDVNNLPDDLNPDVAPTAAADKWRPMWPDLEWQRNSGTTSQDVKDDQVTENSPDQWTDVNYRSGGYLDVGGSAACGMPAQRLKVMSAQDVHDYVYNTDFKAFGGTYHDVGMIWGTRMLSPGGIFGADTAAWPGRKEPARNIVFMTDGTMSPSQQSYGQYGIEEFDGRVGAGTNETTSYNNHIARFRVECDAAKKRGITIYVVAVGVGANPDLTYCASPGQKFDVSSTGDLTAAFKSIAQRVAMLRISQ